MRLYLLILAAQPLSATGLPSAVFFTTGKSAPYQAPAAHTNCALPALLPLPL
ncbi:hypothetical protein EBL_c34800 [Shimwellia blattae DSM 4481 = NBRC 105725]|uniref:Uncharacterized protein n=1 Tax=Shimwellia blattae (strain ATCC 29907 / DSM 4481 / JCM 1650 / NBRC 105725 / CDC 9005-74) TaxID=630626 RepID=I2BDD1_SHIBC|nr:hypothetical protein EBL_c34800 [Shimwellia blattae DSM 4481 = NBRC 105725]